MDFIGTGIRLSALDIDQVARDHGFEAAALRAILAVECRGHGFLPDRRPVILFEPHIFWRELPRRLRPAAGARHLAAEEWGTITYPKAAAANYDRLIEAMKIDASSALKSCSWGIGQVMGFNHEACGFASVIDMVEAMKQSEGEQFAAMLAYISSAGLGAALRRRDWAAFARGYNGPGYRRNRYDLKLASAYDAAMAAPAETGAPRKAAPDWLKPGARGSNVRDLQTALNLLGADPSLRVDGDFGPATERALRRFQRQAGIRPDGLYGQRSRTALAAALRKLEARG